MTLFYVSSRLSPYSRDMTFDIQGSPVSPDCRISIRENIILGEEGIRIASALLSFSRHIASRLQFGGVGDGNCSNLNSISLSILIQRSSRGSRTGGAMEREFNSSINCIEVFRVEVVCSGGTSLKATFLTRSTRIVKAICILKL